MTGIVGIDIAKDKFDVCLLNEAGKAQQATFANCPVSEHHPTMSPSNIVPRPNVPFELKNPVIWSKNVGRCCMILLVQTPNLFTNIVADVDRNPIMFRAQVVV